MNRRVGTTILAAALALTVGLACGKQQDVPEATPAAPPAAREVASMPPPSLPPDEPPPAKDPPPSKEPECPMTDPPPANPPPGSSSARGWRFGDGLDRFATPPPAKLQETCGTCHVAPSPDVLVQPEWYRVLGNMEVEVRNAGQATDPKAWSEIRSWYIDNAPGLFERLPAAQDPGPLEFSKTRIGRLKRDLVMVGNVNVTDLDGDGRLEILVCDGTLNAVSVVRRIEGEWKEDFLGTCVMPVHTAVFDADGDKDLDVAVACMGTPRETDEPTGSVVLLVNRGADGWDRRELANGLPRVTDAQPADFDGDGDLDLAVGAFGFRKAGCIGWLRNDGAAWAFTQLEEINGTIHVPAADLDGDGRADFAALVAQENESITVYRNTGGGAFEAKMVWQARNPLFGSSSLQFVDFDRDGDLDMLFTNGEALGDSCMMPWPYHGVEWLENRGKMEFVYRDVGRCYGPMSATAADFDGDGDLDVAAGIQFGWWADTAETGLVWFRNDGKMNFTRHTVPAPNRLITVASGDLDGDGRPEIVTGQFTYGGANVEQSELLMWTMKPRK
jgi:hypothetical protein